MAESQVTERKPNKFNEIFSTANRFLGPTKAKNPFVNDREDSGTSSSSKSAKNAAPATNPA